MMINNMREMHILWRLESLNKGKSSFRDEMAKIFHRGIKMEEETLDKEEEENETAS